MDDITTQRPTAEYLTAQGWVTTEQVYNLGHERGVEAERAKVLSLLGAQEMVATSEDERDAIWMLRAIIKSGGHWAEKP